jgi:hypothetical protein
MVDLVIGHASTDEVLLAMVPSEVTEAKTKVSTTTAEADVAMMDIVIGHASTDEVLLAMLHWKSLKQSLLNPQSTFLQLYFVLFSLVHFV